ncbi:MAG: TIGR03545 family protein [Termitinemataceae bacterium]|nr:MAG: TIGR03545 family protein [Termitinemataceae bacterium]
MAKKICGLFKKPIKEKLFEKKFLKYIEQKSDKEFLKEMFELKDGFWTLPVFSASKEDLAKITRLNKLAKDIKANRVLPVNFIPLAGAGIVFAGAFIFFTVIMNPLLEGIIENALENVFEAKADIKKFNLNLLRFRVSMQSMTIANADSPMENLIDIGRMEIRLLPQAVLRGKIYIEEIRADSMQFGTERTSSGELPAYKKKQLEAAKAKPPAPPLIDLKQFDAMALIKQEYDNLKSPQLVDTVYNFSNGLADKWQEKAGDTKKQVTDLQSAARPILNFNVKGIDIRDPKSVQDLIKLVADGKTMVDKVKTAKESAAGIVDGVQSDVKQSREMLAGVQSSIQSDYNHLKSFLDFSGGAYKDILNPAIEQILTGTAQKYIMYGKRLLSAAEKLKAYQQTMQAEKPKKIVFKGRDVQFPTMQYPKFYLGIFASDFTLNDWKFSFDLRDVSSAPDLIVRPTTLNIGIEELSGSKKMFSVKTLGDFRANPVAYLYEVEVEGKNIFARLERQLSSIQEIGIGGFEGNIGFNVSANGYKAGQRTVEGNLVLFQAVVIEPAGTIAEALNEAVQEAGKVEIGFKTEHTTEDGNHISINSNLFDLITASLKKAADKYLKQAQAELERALKEYISNYLKEKNISVSIEQLDSIFSAIKVDAASIDSLQTTLQTKVSEMESKVKGLGTQKIDEAKETAQQVANETKGKAEAAAQNAAEETKRRAEAEVEATKKKAEEEAKKMAEDAKKNVAKNAFGKLPF